MIPRPIREFGRAIVYPNQIVEDILKQLDGKYIGFRTEGMVYKDDQGLTHCPVYEIFYSYTEKVDLGSDECPDLEESEQPEYPQDTMNQSDLYRLYEAGVEPNHCE